MRQMAGRRITRTRNRSFRDEFKYQIDNLMTKGTMAKVFVLMAFVTVAILLFGAILALIDHSSYGHSVWQSFLHTLDPGTIAGSSGTLFTMLILFIVTILGILFTSLLIGIINNGMDRKMDDLSKGFTKVTEHYSHTIILGFTSSSIAIIQELIIANENQSHRCPVVIMDEHMSASEMRDEVLSKVKINKKNPTKLLYRNGCIFNPKSLDRVSIEDCNSIIINTEDDFKTMKTVLACSAKIKQLKQEYSEIDFDRITITAIIHNRKYEREAKIAGGKRLNLICYSRLMSKIIAGAGREYGLSYVYNDLFNFSDSEFYSIDAVQITDKLKGTIDKYCYSQYLKNAVVVGGIPRDLPTKDNAFLSSSAHESAEYSSLLVLQRDDNPIDVSTRKLGKINKKLFAQKDEHSKVETINTMIIGSSKLMDEILEEENTYFLHDKGVFTLVADDESILKYNTEETRCKYENLIIKAVHVGAIDYDEIEPLISRETQSVIVLFDNNYDESISDEVVLAELLVLREIRASHPEYNFNITCEMKYENNKVLAEFTGANDYVIGNNLISAMAAQISQTPELYGVFKELLSSEGSEIYMRKADEYIEFGKHAKVSVDCYTLSAAVACFDEVLLGVHQRVEECVTDANGSEIEDDDIRNCSRYRKPELISEYWDYNKHKPRVIELGKDDEVVVIARG